MNIIFDNIIYSLQKSGGGSVYWSELMKRFNINEKVTVIFVDQNEPNTNIFRRELNLKNSTKEKFLFLKIRRYLNFTLKIKQKSIFHSSYFRISKSKNAINITTIHDFTTEKFRSGLPRWINLQQKKYAVKYSEGVICISENTKKDLLHFIPNIDLNKIRVIYNGVSEDFYSIEKDFKISDIDPNFESLENQKYLLYIGHRTDYKNFPIAVKAAKTVADRYKLVIIGENLNESEKKFVKENLGNNYLQVSGLRNHELNFLYNKAFALIYPSSYEGFGIPVIEAMKTKCPVIASNNSSLPEVSGDAGILLEDISPEKIKEAIKMLEDFDFRNAIIRKGIIQADKFNWENTFEQYYDFYKELYDK